MQWAAIALSSVELYDVDHGSLWVDTANWVPSRPDGMMIPRTRKDVDGRQSCARR